jgi:hypothetical protein
MPTSSYIRTVRYFVARAEVLAEVMPEIAEYVKRDNPATREELKELIVKKVEIDPRLADFKTINSLRTYRSIICFALQGNSNPLYGETFQGLLTRDEYNTYLARQSERNLDESPNTLQNLVGEPRQKRIEELAQLRGVKLWEPIEVEKARELVQRWPKSVVAAVINGQEHDGGNIRTANSVDLKLRRTAQ